MANRARRFDDFDWEDDYRRNPAYDPDPSMGHGSMGVPSVPSALNIPVATTSPNEPLMQRGAAQQSMANLFGQFVKPEQGPHDQDMHVQRYEMAREQARLKAEEEQRIAQRREQEVSRRVDGFYRSYTGAKSDAHLASLHRDLRKFETYYPQESLGLFAEDEKVVGPTYRRRNWKEWVKGEDRHWIPSSGFQGNTSVGASAGFRAGFGGGGAGRGAGVGGSASQTAGRNATGASVHGAAATGTTGPGGGFVAAGPAGQGAGTSSAGRILGGGGGGPHSGNRTVNTGSGSAASGWKHSPLLKFMTNTDHHGREGWMSRMVRIGASRAAFGRSIGLLGMFRGVGMTMLARSPLLTGVLATPMVVSESFGKAATYTMAAPSMGGFMPSIDGSAAAFTHNVMSAMEGVQNWIGSGFEAVEKTEQRREARAQIGSLRKEIRKTYVPKDTSGAAVLGTAIDRSVGDISAVVGQVQDVKNEYFKEWEFEQAQRNLKSRFARWHSNVSARSFMNAALRSATRT